MLADVLRRVIVDKNRTEITGAAVHTVNNGVRVYNLDGSVRWDTATTMSGNLNWSTDTLYAISSSPNNRVLALKRKPSGSTTEHRLWIFNADSGTPRGYVDITSLAISTSTRQFGKTVELPISPYILFSAGSTEVFVYNYYTDAFTVGLTLPGSIRSMSLDNSGTQLLTGTTQYAYRAPLSNPMNMEPEVVFHNPATNVPLAGRHFNGTHILGGRMGSTTLETDAYTEDGVRASSLDWNKSIGSTAPMWHHLSPDGKALLWGTASGDPPNPTVHIYRPETNTEWVTAFSLVNVPGNNFLAANFAPIPDASGRYKIVAAPGISAGFTVLTDYTTKTLDVALGASAPGGSDNAAPVLV